MSATVRAVITLYGSLSAVAPLVFAVITGDSASPLVVATSVGLLALSGWAASDLVARAYKHRLEVGGVTKGVAAGETAVDVCAAIVSWFLTICAVVALVNTGFGLVSVVVAELVLMAASLRLTYIFGGRILQPNRDSGSANGPSR